MIAPVTVTVLVDNTVRDMGLVGEHGLCLCVETSKACVLFDTGQGLALPHNGDALGMDLEGVDAMVLSHGHYDHVGGLPYALRQAPAARLFMHPSAMAPRFGCRDGTCRDIGMPSDVCEAIDGGQASVAWTREPTEVVPGMFVTGPIPRRTSFEDTGGSFSLDSEGLVPDPIVDDQAMWTETSCGTLVLLGCAHSGVVNTLDYIRDLTGRKPIGAVVGGMHLNSASDCRMVWTMESLIQLNIGNLWPCHCTGATAMAQLTAAFDGRCHPCGVGTKLSF